MKRFLSILLALIMVLSLSAISVAMAEEHEPVTITFAWWGGDERRDATLEVINQFMEKYPWITVEAQYGSSDGYNDKLATSLSAGTAADVVQIDPSYMPKYVEGHDYFVDYSDYGFDLSKFDDAYLSSTSNGRFDGHQWGLPTGVTGTAVLYNAELMKKVGIDIDFNSAYTWADLIEAGKKVKEYDPSLTLLCTNVTYLARIVLYDNLRAALGDNPYDITTDPVQLIVSKETVQENLEMIKSLFDGELVKPVSYMQSYMGDTLQNDSEWAEGKYLMAITYSSLADVLTEACPTVDWDCARVCFMPDSTAEGLGGGTGQLISVPKASKHIREAMLFVDYFFNDPTAMATLKATRSVPPTEEARKICEENGYISKVVSAACNYAAMFTAIPGDGISNSAECRAVMEDAVASVAYGIATPEQAAEDLLEQMADLIK